MLSGDLFSFLPSIPLINGVEVFFVLSGFLIGGILIRQLNKNTSFGLSDLFHFWKRRWFRTLPNYYLILSVNVLLVYLGITHGNISNFGIDFLFFAQNLTSGFVDFFWESWSLSIEEWFYISLPLLLLLFLRFASVKRALLLSIVSLIIAPLLYRWSIADVEYDQFWVGIHISKVVITRLDTIGYGVLAAFLHFYYPNLWRKSRFILFPIGLLIAYFNIFVTVSPNDFYFRTFYFSVTPLGIMLLLPFMSSIKDFKVNWIGKAITHISLISYSMYLVHLGIIASILGKYFTPETSIEQAILYLSYWGLTILLSTLIYRYFELPTTRLRDRF